MGYLYIGLIKLISLLPFAQAQRLVAGLATSSPSTLRVCAKSRRSTWLCATQSEAPPNKPSWWSNPLSKPPSRHRDGRHVGAGPEKGRTLVRKVHNLEALTDAPRSGQGRAAERAAFG